MRFFVITPEYVRHSGSPYYSPPEYGCDVVEVDAECDKVTRKVQKQVKALGVKELRRSNSKWLQDQRSNGASPFAGLKVEPQYTPETCPYRDIVVDHCDTCGYGNE